MCSPELVHAYAQVTRGQAPVGSWVAALRSHLATGNCPRCARALSDYEAKLRRRRPMADDPALWRAEHLGLVEARRCAPRAFTDADAFLAHLREVPFDDRRTAFLRSHRRLRNPVLIDRFIDESYRHLGRNLAEAHAWLDFARQVIARLCSHGFPLRLLAGPSLRLDAHRANLLRVAGELGTAAAEFEMLAKDMRRFETPRTADCAELASLEASLRLDLRQFSRAVSLLGEARVGYRSLNDPAGLAKVHMQLAKAAFLQGHAVRALRNYSVADELIDSEQHPHLALLVQHNRAMILLDLGRCDEAETILEANRHRYASCDYQDFVAAQAWLEGRLCRFRDRFAEAETNLLVVRDRYLRRGLAFDVGLVSLDLAELYLAWGRHQEVPALAAMVIPIFRSQQVYHEALAAWLLFHRAAVAEQLTATRLSAFRRYLLFARHDPGYRFDETDALLAGADSRPGPRQRRPASTRRQRRRGT
jgi:tetratricopeptide (TPR) repeat protein